MKIGDKIRFKELIGLNYFTESIFPMGIIHGVPQYKTNEGVIKDQTIHKGTKYFLVSYTSIMDKEVCLGFKESFLELLEENLYKIGSQHKIIDERAHHCKIGEVVEIIDNDRSNLLVVKSLTPNRNYKQYVRKEQLTPLNNIINNNLNNKTEKQNGKLSYLQRLQKSQEDKSQKNKEYQAKRAELQLSADILATEQSIAETESQLENLMDSDNLSAQSIISKQLELEGLRDSLSRLKTLEKELFPKNGIV